MSNNLDELLDKVNYDYLNSALYIPSPFALNYLNFEKLVNQGNPESHKTPPMHLAMLDKLNSKEEYIVNLCFRGSAKALALDTKLLTINGWKTVGTVKEGDTIFGEDGKPTKVLLKSEIFNKPMYRLYLRDGRSLDVSEDHINTIIHREVVRNKITKKCTTKYVRKDITTKDLLQLKLKSTRPKTKKNPSGYEALVWIPNCKPIDFPEQNLPIDPYTLGLILGDGTIDRETGYVRLTAHKNDFAFYKTVIPYDLGTTYIDKRNLNITYTGIKGLGKILKSLKLNVHGDFKFIPNQYFYGSIEQRYALLRGLIDTDGTVSKSSTYFLSNSYQLAIGVLYLTYSLGGSGSINSFTSASGKTVYRVHLATKECSSLLPRKANKWKPSAQSEKVILDKIEPIPMVPSQCLMVDNESHTFIADEFIVTHNTTLFMEYFVLYLAVFRELPDMPEIESMIYIGDSMDNGVKSARKNIEFRYNNSDFLKQVLPVAKFTDSYIEFQNVDGKLFGCKLFGATTGLRGTKIFGKRPKVCVMDDLISDEASKSKVVMQLIKDTVYKGVNYALDPVDRRIIFNGTPFNEDDIIVEAVKSGAWAVNVWPVCEKFPCEESEFRGAWPDRFSYKFLKEQYERMGKLGKLSSFYQELMLRIASEDERLIQDDEIQWYCRKDLLQNKQNFNFYITTDFATSSKNTADDSVISVWAYNSNGDWFWVDGICRKQSMDKTIDNLFQFVLDYKPNSVGIEVTGQQGGFIPWLQKEMMTRNIWFNFASNQKANAPGIRPSVDKLSRLAMVIPWFKAGKMYFPQEMKMSPVIGTFMGEIKLATISGIKGHDDCLDTISMLAYMNPWKPQASSIVNSQGVSIYEDDEQAPEPTPMSLFIV